MKKLIILLIAVLSFSTDAKNKVDVSKIFGKIKIVESFPDYKVKVVENTPDLKVKIVDNFPDKPGKWKFVDSL
ncbi:hypothetical protein [Photorhabdus stackebrandtii]|uniref:7(1) septoil knot domain-containing protein n=1 Tax=Photorhabdus stackebrandtii TaxID=1123042 RepID=A0A7X5QLT8_9GAMM|nr:hypothetical protein [Photorhabdus stackebrandtii]NHB96549.1 hypothetical protein [Photorhabdus stackebrandtii]